MEWSGSQVGGCALEDSNSPLTVHKSDIVQEEGALHHPTLSFAIAGRLALSTFGPTLLSADGEDRTRPRLNGPAVCVGIEKAESSTTYFHIGTAI